MFGGEAADGLFVGEDDGRSVGAGGRNADGFALLELLALGIGEAWEGGGLGEVGDFGLGDVEALVEAGDAFEDVEGGREDLTRFLEVGDYGCCGEVALLLLVARG